MNDNLIVKEVNFLDFKDNKKKEIQLRESLFEPLINYFQEDKVKDDNIENIGKILFKSELANPKYEGQTKEETYSQIIKSIHKWKLTVYKKGEFLYHFGEDGSKVYLVIKGQALQMKPKDQQDLQQEIQENKTKMNVIKMFKSSSQINLTSNLTSTLQKSKSFKNIINSEQQISGNNNNLNQNNTINENQNNTNNNNVVKKLQNVCQTMKLSTLKKQQTMVNKQLTGYKQMVINSLQQLKDQDILKELYLDEQTNTFKFVKDIQLNAGELFGKSAVSEDACRKVSVIASSAESDLYVLEISKYNYLKIFTKMNSNQILIDDNTQSTVEQKQQQPSLKQQKYQLFNTLFEGSLSKIKKFMSFFHHYTFPANTILWKKYMNTDKLYIILTGRVEIFDYPDNHEQSNSLQSLSPLSPKRQKNRIVIYSTGKGNLLGELEIVDKQNERIYNVRTLEETQLFGIQRNDFHLCENIVPEIVQQIIEKCQIKKNWISEQKLKIKETIHKYEKNQILSNQRQEVQGFLQEKQKDIKEIKIDTFKDYHSQNSSNNSSPLLKRAQEIQKLKDTILAQQQIKQGLNQKNNNDGNIGGDRGSVGSSNQLSPLTIPLKQVSNNNNNNNNNNNKQQQYFFSSSQIPRQFLKIDLFADTTNNQDNDYYEKKQQSRSPDIKQQQQQQQLSRKNSLQKKYGSMNNFNYNSNNSTQSPILPLHIETEKSTQVLSTQIKSLNSPLSPLENKIDTFFFNYPIINNNHINNNEDEVSPVFQRKVLKLNKLEIHKGINNHGRTFSQQQVIHYETQQQQQQEYQQQHFNQQNDKTLNSPCFNTNNTNTNNEMKIVNSDNNNCCGCIDLEQQQEKIPSQQYINKVSQSSQNRRCQSIPKTTTTFDMSALHSVVDNTMVLNKNKQHYHHHHPSISAFIDDIQDYTNTGNNKQQQQQQFLSQQDSSQHSNNILEAMQQQQQQLKNQSIQQSQQQQQYNQIFRNQLTNQKLKHIQSQIKENRKNNQYRINLEKRSSYTYNNSNNIQDQYLNQTISPTKKQHSIQHAIMKNSSSTHNLQINASLSQQSLLQQQQQQINQQQLNQQLQQQIDQKNQIQPKEDIQQKCQINLSMQESPQRPCSIQQQCNQQNSPSIKSLNNIMQMNSLNSFTNLCSINNKNDKNIHNISTTPNNNKNNNNNHSNNHSKSPKQQNQIIENIQQNQQKNQQNNISFKEQMQKVLYHQRKYSQGLPSTSQSSSCLSSIIKDKKQLFSQLDRISQQQQSQQQQQLQNDDIHPINILNLQQFIDKKKHFSLHNQSNQLTNINTSCINPIINHEFNNNNNNNNNNNINHEFNSNNNVSPSDQIKIQHDEIQQQQQMKQENMNSHKQTDAQLLNTDKQRQTAKFLNEMFNRSQQCRFKALNDRKLSYSIVNHKKSINSLFDHQTNNNNNKNNNTINNNQLIQPQFYSQMNSPNDQKYIIEHHPKQQLQQNDNPQINQFYFSKNNSNNNIDFQSRKSSISPSKPQSKQQHNRSLNKLSQSINFQNALFQLYSNQQSSTIQSQNLKITNSISSIQLQPSHQISSLYSSNQLQSQQLSQQQQQQSSQNQVEQLPQQNQMQSQNQLQYQNQFQNENQISQQQISSKNTNVRPSSNDKGSNFISGTFLTSLRKRQQSKNQI